MHRTLRRILTGLLLTAGLIGLVSLVGGFWVGGQAERISAESPTLQLADTTLTVGDFQRGWLRSTAITRLIFPGLPPLQLHQRLIHNPMSGSLLYLDSIPDPNSIWCGRWLADCATASSRLTSRLSWWGMQQHTLTLPALTLPNLDLTGLHGNLRLGPWAHTGGDLALTVERLTLSEPVLALERSALHAELASRAQFLRIDLETSIDTVELPTIPVGRIDLVAGIERIDRDALAELAASTNPVSAMLAGQRMLRQQPRLHVSGLHWRTEHGELHLNGELTLRGVNLLRLLGSVGSLELIETGRGKLLVDRPLAERLLAQWPMNRIGPADETAAERLARWRAAGFVSLDNNVYHLRFRIDDKRLLLNDTVVAPRP